MSDDWTPQDPTPDEQFRITTALKNAFGDAAADAAERMGLSFDETLEEALEYGLERGAELIGMRWEDGRLVPNPNSDFAISQTTRERANELLQEAQREGFSIDEFASRLEESGLFEDERATLIARNEIAISMIEGKKAALREADVEYGVVYDGDFDDECEARNGTIIEIDEFELLHPNCTADIRPATRSELIEAGLLDEEDDSNSEAEAA